MFECELVVRAGGFLGRVPYWPERFVVDRFLTELKVMERSLAGEAKLQTLFDREHVRLRMARGGSLIVEGELGSEERNLLRFVFKTDQTVLAPLIRDLEAMMSLPEYSGT